MIRIDCAEDAFSCGQVGLCLLSMRDAPVLEAFAMDANKGGRWEERGREEMRKTARRTREIREIAHMREAVQGHGCATCDQQC